MSDGLKLGLTKNQDELKHLIDTTLLSESDILNILDCAVRLKHNPDAFKNTLKNYSIAMVLEKPSMRTRVSFEVGIQKLGGQLVNLPPDDIGFGHREPLSDTMAVLSRYCDAIILRVKKHSDLLTCVAYTQVPIINGLSDKTHPCQALADIMTIKAYKSDTAHLVYIGDGNNVCQSLINICDKLTLNLTVITPDGRQPFDHGNAHVTTDITACDSADVIYTDVWSSMGQEPANLADFMPYQVNKKLLARAKSDAIILHCLPAVRGEEITNSILTGPHSVVFEQAENRLYVQQAVLLMILRSDLWQQWY